MRDEPADRLHDLIAQSDITTRDAMIDPLTGLIAGPAARRLLDFRLSQHPGHGMAYAITMVDVNGLKAANDTRGHDGGDTLLANVGSVLRANLRDGDAFRVGGDEFVIVHEVRRRSARGDAANIQRRLRDLLGPWAAVGTASWDGNSDDTMRLADQLMYIHKASQRAGTAS